MARPKTYQGSMKNDALGNPIEIGKHYGYTQSTSGVSSVGIGVAIKETKTGFTLKLLSKTSSLYADEAKTAEIDKVSVTVKAIHLFPVNIEDVNTDIHKALKKKDNKCQGTLSFYEETKFDRDVYKCDTCKKIVVSRMQPDDLKCYKN